MNMSSLQSEQRSQPLDRRPILIVPYMWIGDFVRCHTVVKLLKARFPARPVDVLSTTLCAPLADYMPEVRQAIVVDLPRKRLPLGEHKALADRLRRESYGTALIMPRTWKAALAPFLAGIPERVGWVGEWRFGLVNDLRWGERKRPRMVDQCAALALPSDAPQPEQWPLPELRVPTAEVTGWRERLGLTARRVVALAPGAVGPSKRWPGASFAELAQRTDRARLRRLDHRRPIRGAACARHPRSRARGTRSHRHGSAQREFSRLPHRTSRSRMTSGLMHVAAALGTPTIGIFGPTSPWHWAPLNPIAAAVQQTIEKLDCQPCHKPTCRVVHHRCMRNISAEHVLEIAQRTLAQAPVA